MIEARKPFDGNLHFYWLDLCKGASTPDRYDIDPTVLARMGLLSRTFIVDLDTMLLRVSGADAEEIVGRQGDNFISRFSDPAKIDTYLSSMRRDECAFGWSVGGAGITILPLRIGMRVCRAIGLVTRTEREIVLPLELNNYDEWKVAPSAKRTRFRVIEGGKK